MDVMMKMTTEDVRRLRAQFSTNLTLQQFVQLMKMSLRDRIVNELDFIVSAIELFHTIDVNGDETLEWDEFAGYILDAGQAKADFAMESDDRDHKRYQSWDLAFRDLKTPMNNLKSHLHSLIYLPDMAAVAYFESGADVVYIYALHFDQNEAPRHFATIRLHTAFQEHVVLDMSYEPVKKWLSVSSMRGAVAYLSVWQLPEPTSPSRSPMMLRRIELACPQEQLTWIPTLQVLATASAVFPSLTSSTKTTKIHQLLLWDLSTLTTLSDFDHRDRIKGVTSMVAFTTPSNRVFLVVGREDGQLTVVETESGHDVQTLDAHGHGVRVLTYSSECEVLASAGAHAYAGDESTHHILIWRINSNGRLSVETTLRDHDAPLQLLTFVDSTRQLLSVDIHGVFHVYSSAGRSPDHEKWQCLQVFYADSPIKTCVFIPETVSSDAVLVTGGSHVAYFDLCVCREREEMLFVAYCRELNLIVGVTATTVLLWQADTGKRWKSFLYHSILRSTPPSGYNDAASDDATTPRVITAVCLDDRERKLLLGDDRGSVRVVNIVNGNVMKALDPHESTVLWLSYVLRSKRVISVSLDSVIHVSDENNPIGYYIPFGAHKPHSVVLRSVRFVPDTSLDRPKTDLHTPAKFEVSRAVGNQGLDLLAMLVTGTQHGESFIQLWNSDLSHAQGTCVAPNSEEITCLQFCGSSGDIVGGTVQGKAYLWVALSSEGTSYRCSLEFTTQVEETTPTAEPNGDPQEDEGEATRPVVLPLTAQIVHILTAPVGVPEAPNPVTSTFLTADGAPTKPIKSTSMSDMLPLLNKEHSIDAPTQDGLYVVAGDENGVITTWLLVQATGKIYKPPPPTEQTPTTSKGQVNTALFQHEEMAMGYEAMAALHTNAQKRNRRHLEQHRLRVCRAHARWQAHNSAVAYLHQSSGDPLVLLSSCASGKVKIWSVVGELLGVLDHFATRREPERRPWRFPVDMERRRRQKEIVAEEFLDRCSNREARHRGKPSMSVLQERLSITPQEMANERLTTPKPMRRRITTVVQVSDVERAIRSLALAQVNNSTTKRETNGSRIRARPITTAPSEPSLHALLTEVSGMQPPSTTPAGGENSVLSDRDGLSGRRRYSMVTLDDLKHALRPRTRLSAHRPTFKSKSSAVVHCDLAPLPSSIATRREVIVSTAMGIDGRIELADLQNAPRDQAASNQDTDTKPLKKRADGVLNYHVKLAHTWNKYAT